MEEEIQLDTRKIRSGAISVKTNPATEQERTLAKLCYDLALHVDRLEEEINTLRQKLDTGK